MKKCNRATKESIIYQKWMRDSAPSQMFNLWPVSLFVCKLPRLNICHTLV